MFPLPVRHWGVVAAPMDGRVVVPVAGVALWGGPSALWPERRRGDGGAFLDDRSTSAVVGAAPGDDSIVLTKEKGGGHRGLNALDAIHTTEPRPRDQGREE